MYVSKYAHIHTQKQTIFFTHFLPWKSALSAKRWFKTKNG